MKRDGLSSNNIEKKIRNNAINLNILHKQGIAKAEVLEKEADLLTQVVEDFNCLDDSEKLYLLILMEQSDPNIWISDANISPSIGTEYYKIQYEILKKYYQTTKD
jgi:hypothetical protein